MIKHIALELVSQRVFALALGYDLNDNDRLRLDALLAAAVGKRNPSGQERVTERDRGKASASSSTIEIGNRHLNAWAMNASTTDTA